MRPFICLRLCRRFPPQHPKGGGAAARFKSRSRKGKAFPHIERHSRQNARVGVEEERKLYFLCGQKREEPGAVFVRAEHFPPVVPARDNVIKSALDLDPCFACHVGSEVYRRMGVLQYYTQ